MKNHLVSLLVSFALASGCLAQPPKSATRLEAEHFVNAYAQHYRVPMGAIYHAQSDAARQAREDEAYRWRMAAVQKRIKVRKQRGTDHVRVSIKPAQKPSSESIHPDPI